MSDVPIRAHASSPAQVARRLDRLCDRFEAAWKAGRRPSLEGYLRKLPPAEQPELFRELLVLELEYRAQSGDKPQRADYCRRFPEHTELIDKAFSEGSAAAPPPPYLLRRWTVNRLASELRMLLSPAEPNGTSGAAAGTAGARGSVLGGPRSMLLFSLLARFLSRAPAEPSLAGASDSWDADTSPTRKSDAPASDGTRSCASGSWDANTSPTRKSDAPARDGTGTPRPAGSVLGDYELQEQLGKGGMGVVYRARQRGTNRIVALKVIRADRLEQLSAAECQEWFERFRREGQIAACVEHDHLVTVYEVGQADGQHYYSMRFVAGQSLAEILRTGPLSNARAARYLEPVARALHVLHQRGIVHRDLKPRNILIDGDDRPFVTDFGLAKCSAYTQGLTQPEVCMGTLEYMAPEQARNSAAAGAASDIYSLGATLYELVTGRPPFRAADPVETLRQVRDEEPLPPRRLNPAVHRDLELICLKCLQKEPSQRYASAWEVAEELQCYRAGKPLRHTRPITRAERVWRWCRRNPALAVASSLALLAILATAVVSGCFMMYQSRVLAERSSALAELAFEKGLSRLRQGKGGEGMLWLAYGLEIAPTQGTPSEWLGRMNLASWGRLVSPLQEMFPHEEQVVAVGFCQDGQIIMTATSDKAQLWETATGKPVGQALALQGIVLAAAISTDGKLILTGSRDHTARLYDAATGQAIGQPLRHGGKVGAVAFSPDGKRFLTGSGDTKAQLWDTDTLQPVGPPLTHKSPVLAVAFSPDGQTVVTGSASMPSCPNGQAQLWNAADGQPRRSPLPHQGSVAAVAFNPDGKAFVTASGNTVQIWNALTGERIGEPFKHKATVSAVVFSPDSKTVLTGATDKTAWLWDRDSKQPVRLPLQHNGPVTSLAFAPHGKLILTGSGDKTARLWEAAPRNSQLFSLVHDGPLCAADFSPDGKLVVTASYDHTARIWDVATGNCLHTLRHDKTVWTVRFSPDGKTVLTGSWDQTAKLWDVATGKCLHTLPHQADVRAVAFSRDGKTVLTGTGNNALTGTIDGTAQRWDVHSGQPVGHPLRHRAHISCVAFSPDGKYILTTSHDGTAQLWQALTGQAIGPPLRHERAVFTGVFSHQGLYVVTGSAAGVGRLWKASSGELLGQPVRHQGAIFALAFSPDDHLILSGSEDGTARLWETATGRPHGAPMQHQGQVRHAAFSPDGRFVLTASDDQTLRLWDAATGRPCGPPLHHPGIIATALFSPNGKLFLTGGIDDHTARLWSVPSPAEGSPERIMESLKVMTGTEIDRLDSTGMVQVLDCPTWRRCRQRLQELGGPAWP